MRPQFAAPISKSALVWFILVLLVVLELLSFAFFVLFCGYYLVPLFVLAVAWRPIWHRSAEPVLVVAGVGGGLDLPSVHVRF
jgi:hypothetical protein